MVHDILRRNHLAVEEASIEATDRVLAALHTVKLDVDFTFVGVRIDADVRDDAVLLLALAFDLALELLAPGAGRVRFGLTSTRWM